MGNRCRAFQHRLRHGNRQLQQLCPFHHLVTRRVEQLGHHTVRGRGQAAAFGVPFTGVR